GRGHQTRTGDQLTGAMAHPQPLDHQPSVCGARRKDAACRPWPRRFPRRLTATRRLAAILAADLAAYSRLMGRTRKVPTSVLERIFASWSNRKSKSTAA